MLEESVIRRRDLRKCFDKIVKHYKKYGSMPSIPTLVEKTIAGKAPRYYLTYDYARRMLSLYRKHRLPRNYNPHKRDMITEIAHKVDQLMAHRPGTTENDALALVLARGEASRFFLSPATARRIIN